MKPDMGVVMVGEGAGWRTWSGGHGEKLEKSAIRLGDKGSTWV